MALVGVGRLLSEAFWPIAQVPLAVEVVDQKGSPLSLSLKYQSLHPYLYSRLEKLGVKGCCLIRTAVCASAEKHFL